MFSQRIYTEAYLYDEEILDEIEDFVHRLEEIVQEKHFELPRNIDLVLELEVIAEEDRAAAAYIDLKSGEPIMHHWTYYYVNHDERVLFWLQPYEIVDQEGTFCAIDQVMCIQSETQISEFLCRMSH